MKRKIVIPEEYPAIKSKPEKVDGKTDPGFELMKSFTKESKWEKDKNKKNKSHYKPKINFKEKESPIIILSLSGKRNFKAVTNWMRKHMETYPETHDGFFVKFIDTDNDNKWYKVEICGEDEKGEKINWINYRISPYIFDIIDDISKDTGKELVEIINGGKNEEADKINRYFDRKNKEKELSKRIVEILKKWDKPKDKQ